MVAQKVPVVFHNKVDAAYTSYIQHLTPYAYKFVEKQIQLKDKVKLCTDEAGNFYSMSSEGRISVSISSCECTSWKSMKLPCRHIFAARASASADLFDETICDERWSVSYYKESQRIFCTDKYSDNSSVEIVQLPAPKKRPLSQVIIIIVHNYNSYNNILMQAEKFHQASKLSTKLASLASEATGTDFDARCGLLSQIISAWENDVPIHLVNG